MTFTSPCLIIWCSLSNSLYQKHIFISCYFDMNQRRHFSLPSYSCLYLSLWSNCDSKDMPLNFHDQIWPHISFPASHFYPPPQPPTSLVLLLACPASSGIFRGSFCSLRHRLHCPLTTACVLSSCSWSRRPSAGTDFRGSRLYTASQPGLQKEKPKGDISMYMCVCSSNSTVLGLIK